MKMTKNVLRKAGFECWSRRGAGKSEVGIHKWLYEDNENRLGVKIKKMERKTKYISRKGVPIKT